MTNPYPAQLAAIGGTPVTFDGEIDFTDPDNQPGGGGFTGWTEDASDPADVDSEGGSLTLSGGGSLIVTGTITGGAFFMAAPPSITGALSTVTDPAAKAVITSIINALANQIGLVTDGTT